MVLSTIEESSNLVNSLRDFARSPSGEPPPDLELYLVNLSRKGLTNAPWSLVRPLVRAKLESAIDSFLTDGGASIDDFYPRPNMETFQLAPYRQMALSALDKFTDAPFTIQRLCELILAPGKHYRRVDKFLRGLLKCLTVVSCVDPVGRKIVQDQDPSEPLSGDEDNATGGGGGHGVANGGCSSSSPSRDAGNRNSSGSSGSGNRLRAASPSVDFAEFKTPDSPASSTSSSVSPRPLSPMAPPPPSQQQQQQGQQQQPTTSSVGGGGGGGGGSSFLSALQRVAKPLPGEFSPRPPAAQQHQQQHHPAAGQPQRTFPPLPSLSAEDDDDEEDHTTDEDTGPVGVNGVNSGAPAVVQQDAENPTEELSQNVQEEMAEKRDDSNAMDAAAEAASVATAALKPEDEASASEPVAVENVEKSGATEDQNEEQKADESNKETVVEEEKVEREVEEEKGGEPPEKRPCLEKNAASGAATTDAQPVAAPEEMAEQRPEEDPEAQTTVSKEADGSAE